MLKISNERKIKIGRAPLAATDQLWEGKTEGKINCSIAALILLLHKYSARLYDQLFLRVKFCQQGHSQEKDLKYTVSEDETFYSLLKRVEVELESTHKKCVPGKKISVEIHWTADREQDNSEYRFRIDPAINGDLPEVSFSCGPYSFFHTVFENATRHYKVLINNALEAPFNEIKNIDYLPDEEFTEIASRAYGPVDEQISKPEFLDELFKQSVERFSNCTAIVYGMDSLSYSMLNMRSNQFANTLLQNGVEPGDLVGILLNRIPDTYAALLGVLKCGAAYVPLDADSPGERVNYILDDASSKYLISHSLFEPVYSGFPGVVLNIDRDFPASESFRESIEPRHESNRSPQSPAYVIYTSGSTGRPKGVVISHAAASNLVKAEQSIFKVTNEDKVAQGFSLAFDASIEEMWLAFSSGAALYPIGKEIMCSGEDAGEFIKLNRITVFSTVPTLLSMMKPPLSSLKLLILGGEFCSSELLTRWSERRLRIVNTYGPTESTVIATFVDFNEDTKITIGKPIINYGVFVTDAALRPVAVGVPGELCIAGQGLATGYLNNSELTAQKFVEPPFPIRGNFPNRIYRSGDLARVNGQCEIEFLGRIDTQVKLRGYRIELSEIEGQLLHVPNIKNAVVTVRQDQIKGEQLIAWLVLENRLHRFDETSCKNLLKAKLASYMVPSAFVVVDDLPFLPSGKVDRKKLQDIAVPSSRESRSIVEPRNDFERRLHEVWTKYFSPLLVSIKDDFFLDLGGHSLLAAKTVSELRKHSGFQDLSVLDVYKNPTIEKLAQQMMLRQATSDARQHGTAHNKRREDSGFRHLCCGVLQFFSLYFVFGFNLIRDMTLYLVFFYLYYNGHSLAESVSWALLSSVASYPTLIAIAITAKWIILGRIKPGSYPLWGNFYLRWWFIRKLFQIMDLHYLMGTPLLPMVYRMLGMKIGRDVHLETDLFAAFDVITIGTGTTIDERAVVSGYSVQNGHLVIGPVSIGSYCFVGTRSVVCEHTVMEDESRLDDLSLLPSGTRLPAGETWEGSPARRTSKINFNKTIQPPARTLPGRVAVVSLYIVLVCLIPLTVFIAFIPGISLLIQLDPVTEPLLYISVLPLVGASFVVILTALAVLLKWILVGKVKPGIYPVHGGFYIRNWIVDQLLRTSLDHIGQLHATLYVASWYRALGMKIGKGVELSTACSTTPDLVYLQDGCTVADEASLGSPHIERGWMTPARIRLGVRTFIGNSAVVSAGVAIGDNSLIGVLSVAPKEGSERSNATWCGSPAVLFPRRESKAGFSEAKTYLPSTKLQIIRGSIELLRITLPPAASIIVASSVIDAAMGLLKNIGPVGTLLALPVVFGVSSGLMILMVAAVKWLVMGRYKPFVHPLWCSFVWRLEFVNALFEFFAAPLLLETLQGTPFLPWYLRLMGAKIGKACYIETTGFLEWDLVEIGDRAAVNENAVIQTHLFEDRILKASRLRMGDDCRVGATSVVLYDSVMENGSTLDALTLLMKGEVLPGDTHWIGIPASSKASATKGVHQRNDKPNSRTIKREYETEPSSFL